MIQDVVVSQLTTHIDERGFFREIFRFPSNFDNIPVGQISHSRVKQDIIKGWHGHVYQHQWNYVISGKIKVSLLDNRVKSPTYKKVMTFIVGDEENPIAYYFPPGVLHGYYCINGPMNIIYITSGIYDINDEVRIEADAFSDIYNLKNE
jgi:dTDP-4-dehydrorhamnose 3,5-epimerase